MTGHYGHKWFCPLGDMTTHLLLYNNGKHVCVLNGVPHTFLLMQELERPDLLVCISVWLSPSLGLRSHPPHAVLFPFIIFSLLLFSAPHISLDMPKCLASIMYRNLSPWPQTWSLPCDSVTPLHSSNTPTFLSLVWAKKIRSGAKLWGIAEKNKWLLKVKPYLVGKSENKLYG